MTGSREAAPRVDSPMRWRVLRRPRCFAGAPNAPLPRAVGSSIDLGQCGCLSESVCKLGTAACCDQCADELLRFIWARLLTCISVVRSGLMTVAVAEDAGRREGVHE